MQISPCPIALPLGKLSALAGVKSSLSTVPPLVQPPSWAFAKSTGCTLIVVLPASAITTSSGATERLSVDDLKTGWARMSKDTIATAWESA